MACSTFIPAVHYILKLLSLIVLYLNFIIWSPFLFKINLMLCLWKYPFCEIVILNVHKYIFFSLVLPVLFFRFSESLRGNNKLNGLTLLGHVVRRQPTWLFKITRHSLFKDLLKLLKVQTYIIKTDKIYYFL